VWLSQSNIKRNEYVADVSDANYKRVMISIVLSIIPGFGQVYSGKLYRGIISYLGLIVLLGITTSIFIKVESLFVCIAILALPMLYMFAVSMDAAFCSIRQVIKLDNQNKKSNYSKLAIFVIYFFIINTVMAYFVGKYIVRAYFVSSSSMAPNIYKNDMILVDKLSQPVKGDIVLIDFSKKQNEGTLFSVIKDQTLRRIIATEGDIVEIRGKQLYIDDLPVSEEYALYGYCDSHTIYYLNKYRWGPEIVPKDSYFVLSDSRQYGFDSRTFGMLNKSYFSGIAKKVLWSWSEDEGILLWKRTALNIN
jgi:signal peptidase I